jgi:acetyltransferase-like isoleucine patch superfamily enzyme
VRNIVGTLHYAIRSELSRSRFVRHVRYRWTYPEFALDPSANVAVAGGIEIGDRTTAGEGCNIIVPKGASLVIGSQCYIGRYVELGPSGHISIGDQTSIQDRSILVGEVSLGRYCVLSLNVLMTSGRHYFDRWPHLLIRDQDVRVASGIELSGNHSQPIVVEEDCWLGMNSVIMPGVTVGRGCVIGSNAVVTRDLPPYSVAVGAPARVVRRRLDFMPPRMIDWSEDEHLPYFYRGFEISDAERKRNAQFGGHVARRGFALCLGGTAESTVAVRIRGVSDQLSSLSLGGSSYKLTKDWQELRLKRQNEQSELTLDLQGGPVVVSQVRVE